LVGQARVGLKTRSFLLSKPEQSEIWLTGAVPELKVFMAETKQTAKMQNMADLSADEPFINPLTGMDARVYAVIAPAMKSLGFRLVRVRLSGLNGLTLQIMAERPDGSMNIEDCELLSQTISPILDVEDVIDRQYNLEVSSPGMDRPLARKSDFRLWAGHLVKIETNIPVEGRKKFRGIIKSVDDSGVLFRWMPKEGGETETAIPFESIADANLVLTDELIRAVLSQDKQEKQKQSEN